jgi:hypothetical protein
MSTGSSGGTEDAETTRVKGTARMAWILGTVAIALALVGPCMSYVPMMMAIPLAVVAIAQARGALRSSAIDEAGQVYGQTATVNAIMALSWSIIVLGIIALIVLMYFGFFVAYIGLILALVMAVPPQG